MKPKYYWIKERHNPQLGVYYVLMGRMSIKEAKKNESPLYGNNYMLKFSTEEDYQAKIKELKEQGKTLL